MEVLKKIMKNIDNFNRISSERKSLREFLGIIGINCSYYTDVLFSVFYDGTVRVAIHSCHTENDNEIWELFDFKDTYDEGNYECEISYAGQSFGLNDTAVMPNNMSQKELNLISSVINDLKIILDI